MVDWKSDSHPSDDTLQRYRRKMRDYLRAAGAGLGLLVFLDSATAERVTMSEHAPSAQSAPI